MSRKRMFFIYNPKSGRGLIKANLPEILNIFSASDYEVITHATQFRTDAFEMAREYAGENKCDIIVCAGGDGTIDEVADGVMKAGSSIPVGIISAGSTNDFGYSLGIPGDILTAAKAVLTGHPFACDIATFNDTYFTYTAAFGTLADVSYDTPQDIKNALGYAAYVLNGMMRLPTVKSYHLRCTYDGKTVEGDYLIGMVVSSNSIGGLRGITGEGVKLDDGLHELILIKAPKKIGDLTHALNEVIARKFKGGKYLLYARVNEVNIEFDEAVPWSLDGEYGGQQTEVNIRVINKGINYLVP